MRKNFKLIFLLILIYFNIQFDLKSDDFYFEGQEIKILNEGNKLLSKKGVKITSNDNLVFEGNEFEYDKLLQELILSKNVIISDTKKNIKIKTNKIKYLKKDQKILTEDSTDININDKYIIKSKNIVFDRSKGILSSDNNTSIEDDFNNQLISSEFKFFIQEELIKAKEVKILDEIGNKTLLENFFGTLNEGQFLGKDVKINFDKKSLGNIENDPRLYGNTIYSNKNISKISKGVFTTCKKNDKCPPWEISAEEIIHDKNKKIINYKNAWLQIYDKPVLYFPKFFHPDPTVKRQTGFLVPTLADSGNTGSSLTIPYFKVLAINKDLTLKPKIYANNNLLIQNEYRHVEKNSSHILDLGLFTSELNNNKESTKSHFFSNSKIDFKNNFFEDTNLEINLEQVSNDTYLKKFQPTSTLINVENVMHSFFKINGYSADTSLSMEIEVFEDLTKPNSDRYQFVYPNINFSKILTYESIPGSFDLSSNLYQSQFDTNKYTKSLSTDLMYNADTKFNKYGLVKDFQILFKNPNEINKTGKNNESDTDSKLLTKLKYSLSYPLINEGKIYDKLIKPSLSFRFSPNNTKNMSNEDRVMNTNNINSFNRVSVDGGIEGGQSLTAGVDYKVKNKSGEDKLSLNLAQVYRDKENPDLPKNSSLNNKYSDIIGSIKFNIFDNLNFDYDFIADNNFNKINYNSLNANISVNNFVTSFQYLEERGDIGTKNYINNQTKYSFDENNSISFSTRENRELNLTEFYNLVYQYENDCLRAALEYNKNFYSDNDVKPEEELLFTLTIVPFSKISSTNISK